MTYRDSPPLRPPDVILVRSQSPPAFAAVAIVWALVAIPLWLSSVCTASEVLWGSAFVALLGAPTIGWCATVEVDATARSLTVRWRMWSRIPLKTRTIAFDALRDVWVHTELATSDHDSDPSWQTIRLLLDDGTSITLPHKSQYDAEPLAREITRALERAGWRRPAARAPA